MKLGNRRLLRRSQVKREAESLYAETSEALADLRQQNASTPLPETSLLQMLDHAERCGEPSAANASARRAEAHAYFREYLPPVFYTCPATPLRGATYEETTNVRDEGKGPAG